MTTPEEKQQLEKVIRVLEEGMWAFIPPNQEAIRLLIYQVERVPELEQQVTSLQKQLEEAKQQRKLWAQSAGDFAADRDRLDEEKSKLETRLKEVELVLIKAAPAPRDFIFEPANDSWLCKDCRATHRGLIVDVPHEKNFKWFLRQAALVKSSGIGKE